MRSIILYNARIGPKITRPAYLYQSVSALYEKATLISAALRGLGLTLYNRLCDMRGGKVQI
ncbi:hypothetical protein NEIPOLOT_01666 [Neisseria polysaccharea ATCC 43768]|nr:hypothetical protein NEIPOLOT_01666 [Neisseria polysaccharea ATCC 43768]